MADLIKIKVKKGTTNLGEDKFNSVILNLDNITKVEQISNKIYFSIIGDAEEIGEFSTVEEAYSFFDKLYIDY